MAKKVISALIVIFVAVCLPLAVITAAAAGSIGAILERNEIEQNVTVTARWTRRITVGQPFEIEVRVRNEGQESLVLHSIDLSADFVDAVTVLETVPPFEASSRHPDFTSYAFGRELRPGGTVITVKAVSLERGTFPLQLDTCIDSATMCYRIEGEIAIR